MNLLSNSLDRMKSKFGGINAKLFLQNIIFYRFAVLVFLLLDVTEA